MTEPDAGEIFVDGQLLAACTPQSTYRHVGIVSPDLPLMRGTVRRNLSYRYRDASDAELERVILNCRIDEVLEELPGGLSAWLTEGGSNISVGQRQRIALARATVGSPRLLLLDEPTTNLDPATKEIFRRVLARYRGTVLLVTHDPAEISLADHVCVMADGRIEQYLTAAEYRGELPAIRRLEAGRLPMVKVAERSPTAVGPGAEHATPPQRRTRSPGPAARRAARRGRSALSRGRRGEHRRQAGAQSRRRGAEDLARSGGAIASRSHGSATRCSATPPNRSWICYGPTWAAANVPPPSDADVVIANSEAPITPRVEPFDLLQQFSYQQQPACAKALADLGIDVIALANNHTMDRGPLGLADTMAQARAAGLLTFGAGATSEQARLPLLIETDIGVLAVVGLSDDGGVKIARRDRPGIRRLNQANIVDDLELARRAGADWVVAYVQWGENYSPVDERQRAFAHALATAGYDLVIGLHPHVVQPVEIVYGGAGDLLARQLRLHDGRALQRCGAGVRFDRHH